MSMKAKDGFKDGKGRVEGCHMGPQPQGPRRLPSDKGSWAPGTRVRDGGLGNTSFYGGKRIRIRNETSEKNPFLRKIEISFGSLLMLINAMTTLRTFWRFKPPRSD